MSSIVLIIVFFIAIKANGTQKYDFYLKKNYTFYKDKLMTKDGRIMDPDRDNITTSEGQSYIMLQSLAVEDKKTFDLAYKWAKNNLQREDKLFSWLWGESKNGKYEILDTNSASDADMDIAFALILAYERWGEYRYYFEAIPIINSIWINETKRIGDYLILMPGAEQTKSEKIEVNPSYFSPYAFRFFQKYDETHDWNCLIDSSYYYLKAVMLKTETGLPPDWFLIENGQIVLEDSQRSDFSYDAIRVFARIYIDYIQTGEKRALPILEKAKFFITKWNDSKTFYTNYQTNGELKDKNQFIGSIAILILPISMYEQKAATEIYKTKLEPYLQNEKYWETPKNYYAKNLLLFGYYLYNKNSNTYQKTPNKRIICH